jgi:hypothetical protein
MVPPEQSILDEASRLINGDRQQQYGDAVQDFGVVAEFWTTYLRAKGFDVSLTHKDVALMMTLLKVRREATHPKRDNIVDGVGYLALAEKCEVAQPIHHIKMSELQEAFTAAQWAESEERVAPMDDQPDVDEETGFPV